MRRPGQNAGLLNDQRGRLGEGRSSGINRRDGIGAGRRGAVHGNGGRRLLTGDADRGWYSTGAVSDCPCRGR